jgi:hypothetical protein
MSAAKKIDWTSTPNERRNRKRIELTLPEETIDALEELAALGGESKSSVVERLVFEAFQKK